MNSKPLIIISMTIGSTLGGLIPMLWHASWLSFSGILLSGVGGIVGFWAG